MALWRDWTAATQGGGTNVTITHRFTSGGNPVVETTIRLSAAVPIGNTTAELNEADSYLSSGWTDDVLFQIREWLRANMQTPGYGVAQVRQAVAAVLGPENTPVQVA